MSDIQCPSCGTMNPAGQELCQTCQARLESADNYQPGQAPTKKVTAELEPILPQWLRDARSQARKSAEEEAENAASFSLTKSDSTVDLLAGLQAQGRDDDDEVPDWLGNITGQPGRGKKGAPEESTEVRWVELGGGTEELKSKKSDSIPVGQAPVLSNEENELPPWLANIQAQEDSKEDTLTGWMHTSLEIAAPEPDPPAVQPPADDEESGPPAVDPFSFFESQSASRVSNTDQLNKPSMEQSPVIRRPEGFGDLEAGLPEWLKPQSEGPGPKRKGDTGELPDWLSKLDTGPLHPPDPLPELPAEDTPSWLDRLDSSPPQEAQVEPPAAETPVRSGAPASDTDSWLNNLGARPPASAPPTTAELTPPTTGELMPLGSLEGLDSPDWLKNLEFEAPSATPPPPLRSTDGEGSTPLPSAAPTSSPVGAFTNNDLSIETPDWLKNLGGESTPAAEPSAALSGAPASPSLADELKAQPAGMTDELLSGSPDWLKSLGTVEAPESESTPGSAFVSSDAPPAAEPSAARSGAPASPAFTADGGDSVFSRGSLSKGDLDSLFMDMPDWLAATGVEPPGGTTAPENLNVIAPGSLPSWVEAMRPVETSPTSPLGKVGDRSLETRGPLAGLQGVLPAVPFMAPSSKPKAYAVKLIASEEQQSHAALLEEVLAVETVPAPIVSTRVIASQRLLRLGIAAVLFVALAFAVFSGTQLFPLPVSTNVAPEVQRGLEAIWAIPENSPVLVVFDYEPARAGELDTLAAPLLDQMILLRHPRLTLLSTSPAGATLAERLFSGPLAGHNYQRGAQFVDLGYLPGGLSGVRAFAQNPAAVSPFAFDGSPAWSSPALQGVVTFDNFSAVLVLTDSAENGKIWIEQAGPLRGASPMVIAASAATGPLLHPYFESGQINGLFASLHDSAIIEQINAGRPGTARRYWDAYNLGLLLAVAFIVGGSLYSTMTTMRERAEARAR